MVARVSLSRIYNGATTVHLTDIDFVGQPAPRITNEVVQGEAEGEGQAEFELNDLRAARETRIQSFI